MLEGGVACAQSMDVPPGWHCGGQKDATFGLPKPQTRSRPWENEREEKKPCLIPLHKHCSQDQSSPKTMTERAPRAKPGGERTTSPKPPLSPTGGHKGGTRETADTEGDTPRRRTLADAFSTKTKSDPKAAQQQTSTSRRGAYNDLSSLDKVKVDKGLKHRLLKEAAVQRPAPVAIFTSLDSDDGDDEESIPIAMPVDDSPLLHILEKLAGAGSVPSKVHSANNREQAHTSPQALDRTVSFEAWDLAAIAASRRLERAKVTKSCFSLSEEGPECNPSLQQQRNPSTSRRDPWRDLQRDIEQAIYTRSQTSSARHLEDELLSSEVEVDRSLAVSGRSRSAPDLTATRRKGILINSQQPSPSVSPSTGKYKKSVSFSANLCEVRSFDNFVQAARQAVRT